MKRSEVKENYKWRVEDIFSADTEWEKAYAEAEKRINFSKYAGKLGDADTLLKLLKESDELDKLISRLGVYAYMRKCEDAAVTKYNAYNAKIGMLSTKYSTEFAFFNPEMAKLDESYLKQVIEDSRFKDYDYSLKRILARKPHVLSEPEERLIGMAGEIFSNFSDIFDMIDDLELPLPEINLDGKTTKLSHGVYSVILHGDDREKRKEAYEKYYGAYTSLINTITQTYFGNVKKDVYLSKSYKYATCLERALFNEDVDRKVYDNLLKSVDGGLPTLHRYIADRKKIFGYDKIYFYDMYNALVCGAEMKLSFDDAYAYVIKGLAPLGKEYQSLLKKGYDERWIDVEETEGKAGGAYSIGCFGVHPFVLLNYQPTTNDIFTVAHEMGHSLHTYFSDKNQPYAKSSYTLFVAEVASTVNEVLLLKYMLNDAKDIALKKYLLNYYLDMIRATLFRQTMFAEFEYKAHTLVENNEPLTKDALCNMYSELGKKYYGNDIEHDYNISCEWARIPHFYRAFYVYKYSTGIITAINIANRILKEGQKAVDDYFKFLSGGSSTDPVSLLKYAGVDLTSTKPFEFAMNEFDNTLKEFEKLMGL